MILVFLVFIASFILATVVTEFVLLGVGRKRKQEFDARYDE